MRATNAEIWQAKAALDEMLKERLPVKTAYWLAKLARKASEQIRDIDAGRVKLIKDYGSTDEAGTVSVSRTSERWPEFEAEFNELMAEVVEFEGLPMEKISLPSDNGLCVSAATLLALEPFVAVAE